MSLDQWTPATVAAAQANRPRRYGGRGSNLGEFYLRPAEILGRMYWAMGQFSGEGPMRSLPLPDDPNYARGRYATDRADWSSSDHWSRFGNVVQTLRQAVARIVRRAKWRRIIRGLRLRARVGEIPTFLGPAGSDIFRAPSMWPHVRDPQQASNQEVRDYSARFGGFAVPLGGLRGTGTQGF